MTTKVSNRPWGAFKPSDYSLQQWIDACVIYPDTPTTAKTDYKLPVKEPDGTLNRNAVHAAAGALAGARGGVNASPSQKVTAAHKLAGFYKILNEDPPASIKALTHAEEDDPGFKHFGIKGMKWGVRRMPSSTSSGASEDATRAAAAQKKVKAGGTKSLSTKELQDLVTRMQLEQQFAKLQPPSKGARAVKIVSDILVQVGKQQAGKLAADLATSAVKQALKR